MRIIIHFVSAIILFSLLLSAPVFSQNSKFERKCFKHWPDVDSIDIYDENAGDFLDINLNIFRKKATDAYEAGQYEAAAKYYMVLVQHDVHDILSIYNLACCYGLLGEADQAAKFLVRAVRAGFGDIEYINNDKDFDKVRDNQDFANTVKAIQNKLALKKAEYGQIQYYDSPSLMRCCIHLPNNYNPEKKYPLVVGLHGYSGTPELFVKVAQEFDNTDVIFVAPQGPYAVPAVSGIGYSWSILNDDENLLHQSSELSIAYVIDLVKNLKKNYNVEKTYLLGFSQGCILTYITGIKNHELFDGLICFGGWLDTNVISENDLKSARDLKVFVSQGDLDSIQEFGAGKGAYDVLKKHGYDVKYFEFHGGHAISDVGMQAAEDWLLK